MKSTGCGCVLLAAALAGCASVTDFADQSQKANIAVEQSANTVLLLNVIRAYDRRPMHFTGLQNIKTPIGVGSPAFSLGLPGLGADRDGRKFYAPSLTYKVDVPNFDVAVWDGQEFMRGITSSIDERTFLYYLDQGWPLPLVLHLLVREVRVKEESGRESEWLNYPGSAPVFERYQNLVRRLSACELNVVIEEPTRVGPELPSQTASDLAGQAKAREQGLAFVPGKNPGTFQLTKPAYSLRLEDAPGRDCNPFHDPKARDVSLRATSATKRSVQMSLRSPEAVIYYLGELVRAQLGDPLSADPRPRPAALLSFDPVTVRDGKDGTGAANPARQHALFVLRRGPVPEGVKPAARAEYEGVTYWIPPGIEGGRSMHALSLVHLLVNSQKNSKDLPAATTIRVLTQ